MAESTSVARAVAPIPAPAEISRAEKLVRERFLHDGEDPAVALAAGTPRRRALDRALAELEADPKAKYPSTAWRREFSLLLGLERLLSEDEPKLADGTVLSAHQVDALSGTLTALLAEAQSPSANGNGRAAASASPELLASADILGPQDLEQAGEPEDAPRVARRRRRVDRGGRGRRGARGGRGRGRRRRSGPRLAEQPEDPTPPSDSGSSTPPAPARRSRRSGSSRRRGPAAC
jgi:hypothetical protein